MNVALKENLKENLAEVSDELPVELLAEVVDFAEFLREKERRQRAEAKPKKKRIAGLHQGQGWISDNFNDELGDEFWFGEDFGIIKKDDESAA
ncbi:MAG: DUF2281 domain-containing protein [Pyrinomonadaceae bacterium]|nr:DUF2281 domain-containing protein [Pyrinomonadaceae bacterium]